ncbi:hypothetical protein WJX72_009444 [[Myrmecia] bisecta]|uniref:Uncharacterized protein n=1 Tax=[Myrmecia] bisecta TaxID=41462 RepID=A0AAW1QFY5_9CHLO
MTVEKPAYPYQVTDTPKEVTDADLAFLSQYTGERDLQQLREHVLSIWRASKGSVWTYKCVQEFMFLHPRVERHPLYSAVLAAYKAAKWGDKPPTFVDVGACFGQDTRKLVLDGAPRESITAIDIVPDYWQFGLDLFKDRETLGVRALFGSLTDDAFVSSSQLLGTASFVWAGAVLHVLSRGDVESEVAGEWASTPDGRGKRYLHSQESLTALLEATGFADIQISDTHRSPQASNLAELSADGRRKIVALDTAIPSNQSADKPEALYACSPGDRLEYNGVGYEFIYHHLLPEPGCYSLEA